jgi:hypothetical protein
MKNSILALSVLSLAFLISSQVSADSNTITNKAHSITNDVHVANNSDKDIAYRVLSSSASDNLYGIKRGKRDTYHAKYGDENTTFEIGECKRINSITGLCLEFDANSMTNCVSGIHYDAYKIRTVTINSASSCSVTCHGGGSSSCVVK